MAKIVNWVGSWVLPSRYKREQPQPADFSSYFDSKAQAIEYANGSNTDQGVSYVGQIISVNEGTANAPDIKLYKVADAAGTLKPIYDEDNIGSAAISGVDFKGAFPTTATTVKKGYMYIATATKTYGTITVEKDDYLLAKQDLNLPANPTQTDIEKFVILEQNLTGALTQVTGGAAQSGKYVSSVIQDGNVVRVTMATLPTPSAGNTYVNTSERYYGIDLTDGVLDILKQFDHLSAVFEKTYNLPDKRIFYNMVNVYINGVLLEPTIYNTDGKEVQTGDYELVYNEDPISVSIDFKNLLKSIKIDDDDAIVVTWVDLI